DVEREAVEGQRQERRVADEEPEPRAGEARSPFELEAADLRVLRAVRRRVTPPADLLRVLLRVPVRRRGVRRGPHQRQRLLPPPPPRGQPPPRPPQPPPPPA